MNLAQIIDTARRQNYLNDYSVPFKFNDTYLTRLANLAQDEACRRSKLLFDSDNVTANDLFTGNATATTINKLVDSTASFDSTALNKTIYNLTDNTFATVTVVDSTTQLTLSVDIMANGEEYVIGDATKALTRVCVVDGTAVYNLSDRLLDIGVDPYFASTGLPLSRKTEGWLNRYYYQWRQAEGRPLYYMLRKGKITLIPKPNETLNNNTGKETLIMSCYRLPLTPMALSDNNDPEISSDYHLALVNGMCMFVFGDRQDNGAVNIANIHAMQFNQVFGLPISAKTEEVDRILSPMVRLKGAKW